MDNIVHVDLLTALNIGNRKGEDNAEFNQSVKVLLNCPKWHCHCEVHWKCRTEARKTIDETSLL